MNSVGFTLAAPSKGSGGKEPLTVERALASGYAEAQGALVVVNSSNQFAAVAADSLLIAGVAVTPGGTDTSGFNILGHKEFPPGYIQVYALKGQLFAAPYVGTLPTYDGGTYGFVRDTDGVYKGDFTDDVNVALTLVGRRTAALDGSLGLVLVRFLDSVCQEV